MADTLEVFGVEFTGVNGIKAYDDNEQLKTFVRPQGTKSITANGQGIDVASYESVNVAVPGGSATLQEKTKSYTPTETAQSETVSPDSGYDGLSSVAVSVGAISSTYVGSGIDRNDSNDLTASGATVTAPAGYYENAASKSVSAMTLPTSTSGSSSGTSKATVSRSTSDQYINIPTGYNDTASYYKVNAVANGTEGTPTATKGTVSNHSVSVTPSVTNTAGYISGSTKTGTAVTVSASELVSGSETKTANGTYDVTNLAELIVNVSGGGGSGLVYEAGTYTPASDVAETTITFTNSHSSRPCMVLFADATNTAQTTNSSAIGFVFEGFYDALGTILNAGGTSCYSRYSVGYKSSGTSVSWSASSGSTSTSGPVTNTTFKPISQSITTYFRAGRTYKWIAVWAPTT